MISFHGTIGKKYGNKADMFQLRHVYCKESFLNRFMCRVY